MEAVMKEFSVGDSRDSTRLVSRACPRFSCSHSTVSEKKNKRLLEVWVVSYPYASAY